MFIANSILPVFLLIALGKILHKTAVFPDEFFKGLNRLVFRYALPSLLIISISTAEIDYPAVAGIILLFSSATLISLGIAWGVAGYLKLDRPSAGSFIQGSFRGNGAFIGLPVIIYSLGTIDPHAEVLSTVVLAAVVLVFNVLSVTVLLHHSRHKSSSGQSTAAFMVQLIRNPLILACALGLLLNQMEVELPLILYRPLNALGRAALPLILISIGSSLKFVRVKGAASPTLIASLLKVAVTPAVGLLLAPLLPLETTGRMIAVIYLACPTAGMSYVMAEVMGNDAPLAGRIVALSTLLSAVTLPIIMAIGL